MKFDKRPIVFCDVDGVLAPFDRDSTYDFDVPATEQLRDFQQEINARVVISSTWCGSEVMIGHLVRHLTDHGVEVGGVCRYDIFTNKPDWCRKFLKEHHLEGHPWVMLDDEDYTDQFKGPAFNNYVMVHPVHMLTKQYCSEAKARLICQQMHGMLKKP